MAHNECWERRENLRPQRRIVNYKAKEIEFISLIELRQDGRQTVNSAADWEEENEPR